MGTGGYRDCSSIEGDSDHLKWTGMDQREMVYGVLDELEVRSKGKQIMHKLRGSVLVSVGWKMSKYEASFLRISFMSF